MREPLLHFLLIGALLFGLHRMWSGEGSTVEISSSAVSAQEADFTRRTGSPPDATERALILEAMVEEEILYREGRSLSLEAGDPILRRRVVARMRLLMAATAPAEPTDDDLRALLAQAPERYTRPPRLSLVHVFLDASRHPSLPDAQRRVEAMLLAGADPIGLGDPFLHGRTFTDTDEAALAERFGTDFAAEVIALSAGEWWPVRSRYGEHLVWIEAHEPARPATLSQARQALTADWTRVARQQAEDEAMAAIRARYSVSTP